jgi:beta-galactosidase
VACIKPGTLKAIGYIDNKMVTEHTITTSSVSEHLTLQVDESGISPTRNDVIFVYATINDHNNTIVHNDSCKVAFAVDGAQLIGPAKVNAQAGIATALIRTRNSLSKITITATAPGLRSSSLKIEIH